MAEIKTKDAPADSAPADSAFTFKFDEKTAERIADGKRKLVFKDLSPDPAARILVFKNARGLSYLDFLLPSAGNVTFSTLATTHVEYCGSLADLEVDFVWTGWKPNTGASWHVEPLSGWSFELSVEDKH